MGQGTCPPVPKKKGFRRVTYARNVNHIPNYIDPVRKRGDGDIKCGVVGVMYRNSDLYLQV
ncbi:hypothetical protein GCM10011389_17320 [Pontibacillus salipaludis]|uniref:Uncharacterized protein n=1 Tax=Pontibacillus salipaludis TaxID=1697394 RepID=A0ABQ1Q2B7_9BACI|nr:hypothetical protein GCM10011389_17320 [Pontibacillus salipaludis]